MDTMVQIGVVNPPSAELSKSAKLNILLLID